MPIGGYSANSNSRFVVCRAMRQPAAALTSVAVTTSRSEGPPIFVGASLLTPFPIGRVAIFAGVLTPKDWRLLMQAFTGV